MKAMILAAGRGTRLAPLTDRLPKPLIEAGGTTLIERHLRRLAAVGVAEVVVNLAHLGELIAGRLGDGSAYGLGIAYSREPDGPLETGGGIARALPLLGAAPFLLVNADTWTDYPFEALLGSAQDGCPARLVLVPNPAHHPRGDFQLQHGLACRGECQPFTYAGIGRFDPALFARAPGPRFPLAPLLFELAAGGRLAAERYDGPWYDVGTPERLAALRAAVGP